MSREVKSNTIGSDLMRLATLLNQNSLCNDTGPLDRAGGNCVSNAVSENWGYNLDKMIFKADEVGGRLAADTTDITVSLSIVIKGRTFNTSDIYNPIDELFFDIEINGFRPNIATDDVDRVYSAWHLDRHIFDASNAPTKYSHPLYHFTFGGEKMEAKGHDNYGNSIILPSPRLMYPPMDAVLGIDFVLQNYIRKDKLTNLLEDPEYNKILQNSQTRIWKPFFCSLYSHWDTSSHSISADFIPTKLFPFYC